jgi:hypothetical protein
MSGFRIAPCALFAALYVGGPALSRGADPNLTIYNENFAVIRESVPLDLKAGDTVVRFSGVTAQVEPDSVILRDPTGTRVVQVIEQNYRNDPISQDRLLSLFEGKTIEFVAGTNQDGSQRIVVGAIVRSGYVPHYQAMTRYGSQYAANQMGMAAGGAGQPVIEVNGKLQFFLPGQPIFPTLGDDTILKPALDWVLHSAQAARFDAELSYVSGGLSWDSDYNIVAPETGDALDLVGWVTLDNQSGKQFDHAHIKLMAGDVNKVQPRGLAVFGAVSEAMPVGNAPQVTERTFEDYHLYTLPQPTTLRDRETKQVEFLRASGIGSRRVYVYDGMANDQNWGSQDLRGIQQYGTKSNPHVWVVREFVNSAANHLGAPLPKGRVRFYRRDQDGQLEFTGEDEIDHTPKDETVRLYTGNAFDITGERRQTHFQAQTPYGAPGFTDESFEIKLRNHKEEAVTVQIVEHLNRWATWVITQESAPHSQTDSRTIVYDVSLRPGEEKTVTYTAHYTW